MNTKIICYNLYDPQILGLPVLPEAYIVALKNEKLGYLKKVAQTDTLRSFKIDISETQHALLLDICKTLKPAALEQQFKPKKSRKKLDLTALLKDIKIKKLILNFVTQKLNTFYEILTHNPYHLCLGADRNDPFEKYELTVSGQELQPLLEFTKTETGIDYAFALKDEAKTIIPKEHDILILLNDPSWIILDQSLYRIEGLNANKLKPFFSKETISIKQKTIKTYMNKVIIPIIKNVDVTANGFEILIHSKITGYRLETVYDFVQKYYVAKVVFAYGESHFDYHANKYTDSSVALHNENEITITQTQRDHDAEKEIIHLLVSKGLRTNANLLLETQNNEDPFAIVNWLKTCINALKKEGFNIKTPLLNDKNASTAMHSIALTNELKGDWFDIRGTVKIGEREIAFSEFIDYIKRRDRLFPLDGNQVFIIPGEWLKRYQNLAEFAEIHSKSIRINKSNYTLLENVVEVQNKMLSKTQEVAYTPSSKLKATLRPYQHEGVSWLINHYHNGLGACLADDMGLGKTLQTIAVLAYAKDELIPEKDGAKCVQFDLFSSPLQAKTFLKALTVLPASLIFNWANEIRKFAPYLTILNYTGPKRKENAPNLAGYDIILTTYSTLHRDIERLKKFSFNYLIIDESQQIKNKESKIFKSINSICAGHKLSLSGTPIENSLSDLWSQMQFINPGMLGSFSFFKEKYKNPIEKNQDEDRVAELKSLIDPFILRRTKEQVAQDLPELSEQILYAELLPDQHKLYQSLKSAARNDLLGIDLGKQNKIHIINMLMKLRQVANHPKLIDENTLKPSGKFYDVTAYLSTLIKARKKVLIFSSFVSHLTIYENWCDKENINYVSLTGQTKTTDREAIIKRFQNNDSISLFFISLKAGGTGLNLTAASYVVLLDPWWNPFAERQAIARAHRIGQKSKVMVSRFITRDTIEEKIIKLQEQKQLLSDTIIDVEAVPELSESDLMQLLG